MNHMKLNIDFKPPDGSGYQVAVIDSSTLFLANYKEVYESNNAGETWELLDAGGAYRICCIRICHDLLYIGTNAGLIVINLSSKNVQLKRGEHIQSLTVLPDNPDHLICISGSGESTAVMRSHDRGEKWEKVWRYPWLECIALDSQLNPLVGGRKAKLFRLLPNGTASDLELFVPQRLGVNAITNSIDNRIYIGFSGGSASILRSDDDGNSWHIACSKEFCVVDMQTDPNQPDIAYATCYLPSSLFITKNAGKTWHDVAKHELQIADKLSQLLYEIRLRDPHAINIPIESDKIDIQEALRQLRSIHFLIPPDAVVCSSPKCRIPTDPPKVNEFILKQKSEKAWAVLCKSCGSPACETETGKTYHNISLLDALHILALVLKMNRLGSEF